MYSYIVLYVYVYSSGSGTSGTWLYPELRRFLPHEPNCIKTTATNIPATNDMPEPQELECAVRMGAGEAMVWDVMEGKLAE